MQLDPGLIRLVRQGLLKASWGTSESNRRAKFYELTATGRRHLREETDNWNRLAAAMRSSLRELDAGLPVYIQTWYKKLEGSLIGPRVATISLGVLGGMGGMLSVTGIFGMAAYSVSKRKKELGIRMALGAQRVCSPIFSVSDCSWIASKEFNSKLLLFLK